ELIQPDLQKKFFSKSLLHDKLISLQLAAYLCSNKFKVNPIIVKDYLEQHIFSQLQIEPLLHISVCTTHRWIHKLRFCYKCYQVGAYVDGHEHPDIIAYCAASNFLAKTIGRLKDDQEEARVVMELGTNKDGYWNSGKLLKQVRRALDIFE
ncbi:43928_t:CDS:2, partial [Gigaspora margarita]